MPEARQDYNVFISWSGDVTKQLALAIQSWLQTTIQASMPFVSEKDIDAGDRGLEEIAHQLDKIKVGIVCLTAQNQHSPWINFEAGAISKRVPEKSYVIGLLLDLEPGQVKFPLAQFQNVTISQANMVRVAKTVNRSLGLPLAEERVEGIVDLTWTQLAGQVEQVRAVHAQQSIGGLEPRRTAEDMFEEIVVAIREQGTALNELSRTTRRLRTTPGDIQLRLLNDALRKLSDLYQRPSMTVTEVAELPLDAEDWRIIETAPYLKWYLTHYHNVTGPVAKPSDIDEMGDVPF